MSIRLKPYPKYKESGIQWLGKAPAHWNRVPFRAFARTKSLRGRPEMPLLSVYREYGVIMRSSRDDNYNPEGSDLSAYKVVSPGDLVLNKMKTWQGSLGVSRYHGIVSPAYIVCSLSDTVFPWYIHYLLRSRPYVNHYDEISFGIRIGQWDMHYEHLKQVPVYLPPIGEQNRIVRYLKFKDCCINSLIRAKRRQIKLRNEQKQVIINQAVTRGLDPNARMKPSGVEWLGDIPEEWRLARLKFLGQIRYGLSQPPRESPVGVPFIRATNIKRGKIVEEGMLSVSTDDVPPGRNAFLRAREIIVVRSGAYTADSALIPTEYDGSVAGYDMVLSVESAYPEFIALTLLSKYVLVDQLFLVRDRAAQPHLNAQDLGNTLILLPPYDEQRRLADSVQTSTADLDRAIDVIQREINLLHEYRTRLIADVVTGKLDVRGVELPDIDVSEGLDELDEEEEVGQEEIIEPEEMDVDEDN